MPYIIGIDPGKSLGMAMMLYPYIPYIYQGDVENGMLWLKDKLQHASTEPNTTYVAIEKFIVTPGTGRRSGASKTSAIVQRCIDVAESYPRTAIYMQSVSDASRFSNDLLRKLNFYIRPNQVGCKDSNDANSAVRHILLCLARNRADLLVKIMEGVEL